VDRIADFSLDCFVVACRAAEAKIRASERRSADRIAQPAAGKSVSHDRNQYMDVGRNRLRNKATTDLPEESLVLQSAQLLRHTGAKGTAAAASSRKWPQSRYRVSAMGVRAAIGVP
jgi:hypothetical protein